MNYFPAFLKLDDIDILIVGGGHIATEKIEKLLDFTDRLTIIAPEITAQMQHYIQQYQLSYHDRIYQKGDIGPFGVVIIAVDDISLQKEIYEESRDIRCFCNAVDAVAYCDFIFPSYIKKDKLTLAISTSGASPAFAKQFKQYLEARIPECISTFLEQMQTLRSTMPKGRERMQFLEKKVADYIASWKD